MSPLLFALFLATFAIGTTEFAVVGLLPDIAANLDVSISQTGLARQRLRDRRGHRRRRSLSRSPRRSRASGRFCSSARIFVVGHACWLRSRRTMVGSMGARVLRRDFARFASSASRRSWRQGSVPPERSARAVSFVWLGFSAASLVGVPSATAIGHAFGWRAAFWMLAAVGVVAGVALQRLDARVTPRCEASSLRQEVVAPAASAGAVGYGDEPSRLRFDLRRFHLCRAAPLGGHGDLGWRASAYAVVVRRGRRGGHGDRRAARRLEASGVRSPRSRLPMLSSISSLIGGHRQRRARGRCYDPLGLSCSWRRASHCRHGVVRKAIDGPNLASTLNQSAFNVGNALGPTLGAAALALGFDYRALPWIGSALALLCAATALFSRALEMANRFRSTMARPSAPR